MHPFIQELKNRLISEVRSDPASLAVYSVDASIYEITPACVVLPRTQAELLLAVEIAGTFQVPVTARGAATGITGGCLGTGLVIDCSKYLNKIVSIDIDGRRAVVEPGCVQDDLNKALAPFGYRLGPDTSTGNRATIGGMVANNAAGAHALKFGRMVDHVEEVELILAGGKKIVCRALTRQEWDEKCLLQDQEGEIYRALEKIRKEEQEVIEKDFPKVERRSSGFNLNELIKPDFCNLAKIITGSEGTLGVISKITVSISENSPHHAMVLLSSGNLVEGLRRAHRYLEFQPYALELIDRKIIEAGRNSPSMQGEMEWLEGNPEALFVVEFEEQDHEELLKKCTHFYESVKGEKHLLSHHLFFDEKTQNQVWKLRKSGLGLLLSRRSYSRAIAFIEDLVVPPEKLADFIVQLTDYLKSQGKEAGIYGHIGDGCLHVRPYMDLGYEKEKMVEMMLEVAKLVKECGGSLSAEHGDGKIRTWLNPLMYGEKIYSLFVEIKRAFDPENIMNPGNIVNGQAPLDYVRLSPEGKRPFKTFMHFEGGVELHVDLCNGNGQCRKKEGIMCPSFQVTLDEKDSTRARANALRAVMQGKVAVDEIHDVMDLCIQCKGCKTECPSQVDMAKLKAEFLHTQKKSLRDYIFGHIGTFLKIGSIWPTAANFIGRQRLTKWLLTWIGITDARPLPTLSKKRFSKLFQKGTSSKKKVVLFNDTFTEFTASHVGVSAQKVLEYAGFEVILLPYECCGRTLISKGYLEEAKAKAEKVIERLYPYAKEGIPIVGIEPSCLFTIRDEFKNFGFEKATLVAEKAVTIEELLLTTDIHFKHSEEEILVHGHCHQKALIGMSATMKLLARLKGAAIHEINSGCCGMAGSFGYETEHYEFSEKIGELKLFPELRREPNHIVIADGTSCRHQIHDALQVRARHIVEILATLLE